MATLRSITQWNSDINITFVHVDSDSIYLSFAFESDIFGQVKHAATSWVAASFRFIFVGCSNYYVV